MPIEITMPKLSDTMEEGTILRWLKRQGEHVEAGEPLAEVETDKADMELEASSSGTLSEIRVQEGQSAVVGAVIAVLGDGEAAATSRSAANTGERRPAAAEPSAAGERSTPPAAASAEKGGSPPNAIPPGGSEHASAPAERNTATHASSHAPAGRIAPVGGRPTAPPPRRPTSPPAPTRTTPSPPPIPPAAQWKPREPAATRTAFPPAAPPSGRQEQSKVRLAVAKQMTASKRDIPHFYVTAEVEMDEAAKLRAALSEHAVPERITFTHLLIRAVAATLPQHPRLNAAWEDGAVTYHDDINIGVAVAVADALVAPVLRGCQRLSLRDIARATAELVEKAQAGRFGGDELTGATFTISNMGMLDIEEFSAVIIPPQAAILAIGAIKGRPVVRDQQLAIAKTMRMTLSADHRVVNGVEAGRFLEALKEALENPVVLVLPGVD